jgi:hypothetical protein
MLVCILFWIIFEMFSLPAQLYTLDWNLILWFTWTNWLPSGSILDGSLKCAFRRNGCQVVGTGFSSLVAVRLLEGLQTVPESASCRHPSMGFWVSVQPAWHLMSKWELFRKAFGWFCASSHSASVDIAGSHQCRDTSKNSKWQAAKQLRQTSVMEMLYVLMIGADSPLILRKTGEDWILRGPTHFFLPPKPLWNRCVKMYTEGHLILQVLQERTV